MDWESCTLTRYDTTIRTPRISGGLAEHRLYRHRCGIGDLFPGAGPVLTLRLRGRIHETGVYLQWVFQRLGAAAIPAGSDPCGGFRPGDLLWNQHGHFPSDWEQPALPVTSETYETVDLTGESDTAEEEPIEDLGLAEIEVAVSAEDYALVWAFGMVLCVASTALAAYPIMKMKPKSILSQMS